MVTAGFSPRVTGTTGRVRGAPVGGPAMNKEFRIFISVLRQDSCLFSRMRLPRTALFQ